MNSKVYQSNDVFGTSRNLPPNYVERDEVDNRMTDVLERDQHVVVYGASKQGKTCLRKQCIEPGNCIVIQCNNRWDLSDIHASILKEAGYKITISEKEAISGSQKIIARIRAGIASGESQTQLDYQKEQEERGLELDPKNVNGIIRALNQANFDKYIILEDFHYLPTDV